EPDHVGEMPRAPDYAHSPELVVLAQLAALQQFDVETVFAFASPANQEATGPVERFKGMLESPPYDILLGHRGYKILSSAQINPTVFIQFVQLEGYSLGGEIEKPPVFQWTVSLQLEETSDKGVWDRSGVGLALFNALVAQLSPDQVEEVNLRISTVGKISGTDLPSDVSDIGAGFVRSEERGNLMSVMPYILKGISPTDRVLQVFTTYNEWREIRDDDAPSDATVDALRLKRIELQRTILAVFPDSNWKFPKFFNMRHYEPIVKRFGPTWRYCTGYFEHTHHDLKKGIPRTNSDTTEVVVIGTGVLQRANDEMEIVFAKNRGRIDEAGIPWRIRYSELKIDASNPSNRAFVRAHPALLHFEASLRTFMSGEHHFDRRHSDRTLLADLPLPAPIVRLAEPRTVLPSGPERWAPGPKPRAPSPEP
ncbi:hypothetical protein CYMTET_56516, partial [Cymbomonas tetramitiformis]